MSAFRHSLLTLLSGAGASDALNALASGVKAAYPLTESGSGDAISALTGGQALTPTNGPTGVSGGRQFVASSSQDLHTSNVAPFTLGNEFTIACSVKFTTKTSNQILAILWDGTNTAWELLYNSTFGIQFVKQTAGLTGLTVTCANFQSPNSIQSGTEYTPVIRCDGTYLFISVNGGPESRVAWVPGLHSASQFVLGGVAGVYLDATLADFTTWDRDITSAGVAALYGDGSTLASYPFAGATPGATAPITTRTDKIYQDGTRFTQFPLVTKLSDGTYRLLVADNLTDEAPDCKIQYFHSVDGITWTGPTTLETNASLELVPSSPIFEQTVAPPNAGGAVHDLLRWTRVINSPTDIVETQYRSTDGGTTWATDIADVGKFGYTSWAVGYGRCWQLASGRVLRPLYSLNGTDTTHTDAYLTYSDDGGKTWVKGAIIFNGQVGQNAVGANSEMEIFPLGGSNWTAVTRVDGGATTSLQSFSTDDGVTWSTPVVLQFVIKSPTMQWDPLGNVWLICNNEYRISRDKGVTWGPPHTIKESERWYITTVLDGGVMRVYSSTITNPAIYHAEFTLFEATIAVATAGTGQNVITWRAIPGTGSYTLKRATVSGGPYTTIYTGTGTSFTDTGLTNGTEYFYVVDTTSAPAAGTVSALTFMSSEVNATPEPDAQVTTLTNLAEVWRMEGADGATEPGAFGGHDLASVADVGSVVGHIGNARRTTIATQNYLSTPDAAALRIGNGPFELSSWVFLRDTPSQTLFSKWTGGVGGEWNCFKDTSNLNLLVPGIAEISIPLSNLPQTTYTQVNIGYDGTKAFIAINGVIVGSNTGTPVSTNTTSPLEFGRNTASSAWWSSIDYDVTPYWVGRALTAFERTWMYNGGAGRDWDGSKFV